MTIVLNGTTGITNDGGYTGDGVSFADTTPANTLVTTTGGNVGIGTNSPQAKIHAAGSTGFTAVEISDGTNRAINGWHTSDGYRVTVVAAKPLVFLTSDTERMRIDSSGRLLVGKTATDIAVAGVELAGSGLATFSRNGTVLAVNRLTTDGVLIDFSQAGTVEGTISVSGTTVSYNGGHLSRWSQLLDNSKDESLLKGTVLSNLDEMCVWEKDGVVAENEQLNKMKVSDVEGDTNVAGIFVNWTTDEDYNSDDMNIAMTGDMIIRIAEGVTVQRGDLLMSAGDGTAKPQGDDIVRSKTIAKVTSTNITCTYADGSYCVPCVLMAC
jgi:hypothetical protein